MLRISKMTDYGTLVLSQLGADAADLTSATEIATRTGLGGATVSKLLKSLAHADLVVSQRGSAGGYALSRPAADISAAEIIDAIEGPLAITECSAADQTCNLEAICGVGSAWQRINAAIRHGLEAISLEDLRHSPNITNTFPITLHPVSARKARAATAAPNTQARNV